MVATGVRARGGSDRSARCGRGLRGLQVGRLHRSGRSRSAAAAGTSRRSVVRRLGGSVISHRDLTSRGCCGGLGAAIFEITFPRRRRAWSDSRRVLLRGGALGPGAWAAVPCLSLVAHLPPRLIRRPMASTDRSFRALPLGQSCASYWTAPARTCVFTSCFWCGPRRLGWIVAIARTTRSIRRLRDSACWKVLRRRPVAISDVTRCDPGIPDEAIVDALRQFDLQHHEPARPPLTSLGSTARTRWCPGDPPDQLPAPRILARAVLPTGNTGHLRSRKMR